MFLPRVPTCSGSQRQRFRASGQQLELRVPGVQRHLSDPRPRNPAPPVRSLEQRFKESFTMSQVYVQDRPAPIPLTEHERRRKVKELEEIAAAGKRKGVTLETVRSQIEEVDRVFPGLINLHKAKASEWITIISSVDDIARKLITLKDLFPNADIYKILSAQPRALLKSVGQLTEEGTAVKRILQSSPSPDAIIQAVPDLMDPINLQRSLSYISSSFGGRDPIEVLTKHPDILSNMGGESNIEDSAEYGEISTKD